MGTRKTQTHFIDADKDGGEEVAVVELPPEEWPRVGDYVTVGRRRSAARVNKVTKHYGKNHLLRVEVWLTRKTLAEAARDALGSKAAERVKK